MVLGFFFLVFWAVLGAVLLLESCMWVFVLTCLSSTCMGFMVAKFLKYSHPSFSLEVLLVYVLSECVAAVLFLTGVFLDLSSLCSLFCLLKAGVIPFFVDSMMLWGMSKNLETILVQFNTYLLYLCMSKAVLMVLELVVSLDVEVWVFISCVNLIYLVSMWASKGFNQVPVVVMSYMWSSNLVFMWGILLYSSQESVYLLFISVMSFKYMISNLKGVSGFLYLIMFSSPLSVLYWIKILMVVSVSGSSPFVTLLFMLVEGFHFTFLLHYINCYSKEMGGTWWEYWVDTGQITIILVVQFLVFIFNQTSLN